jgi:hypothetical protein
MRRSTEVHSTVSEMVLRQRAEIRLADPFSQIFSQFCMSAHDFVTNTVVLTKARAI